jgi:hypothetical protein
LKRAALLAASAASLLLPQRAGAAPRGVPLADALHVEPNACFDAGSLAPVLQRWLKRDALDPRLRVEITGQPQSADGLSLRVLRDGVLVGERHFPGLSAPCEDVRAAVGLATAFALDATVLESLGMKPVQPPTSPPPAPPLPAPPPPPAPSRSWPRFDVSVEPGALFGVLPAPTDAIVAAFGVRLAPPFEIRLSGVASAAAPLSLDGRSFGVTLLAARAEGCAAFWARWIGGRGCAGAAAGRLLASSTDARSPASQTVPWAAAVARADVRVPLTPRFGLVLGADAIVPLTRPHFVILGPTGASIASAGLPVLGGAVTFGPEVTFP